MKLTLRDIQGIAYQRNRDKYNTTESLIALAFAVAIMGFLILGGLNMPNDYPKNEGNFIINSTGTLVLEDGEYPMLNGYRLVSADAKDTRNQPLAIVMFVFAGILTIGVFWVGYQVDKRWHTYRDKMKQEYMDTGNVPSIEP